MDKKLAIMLYPAKYLALGLNFVIIIPAVNVPIAEKTKEIVPVTMLLIDK